MSLPVRFGLLGNTVVCETAVLSLCMSDLVVVLSVRLISQEPYTGKLLLI